MISFISKSSGLAKSSINKIPSVINYTNNNLLTKNILYPFTIKNYMKTYQLQNVASTQSHLKHNIFRVDQFKNLSTNQSTIQSFVNQQNKAYQKSRKLWQPRTQKYYQKCSQRRDTRIQSTQQEYDDFVYYTVSKYHQDKQYTVIYRKHNSTRKEELVLDIMQYYNIKKHFKTVELVRTSFSNQHRYVAFGYDLNNNEHVRWMVKDMKENKILGVKGWSGNVLEQCNQIVFYKDQGIFYTKTNNRRPSQIYFQEFNSQPILVYQQKDPSIWLYIQLSKDKKYLIINSSSKSLNQVKYIDLQFKKSSQTLDSSFKFSDLVKQIPSRNQNQKVHINHAGNKFIIWRQQEFQNKISIIKDDSKQLANKNERKEQVIHRLNSEQILTDMDVFEKYIVLYIQQNTKPIMRLINLAQKDNYSIVQPTLPYQIGKISPGMNQKYSTSDLLFFISTPFVYNQGYSYNLQSNKIIIKQKFELSGPKFRADKYQIKTLEIPAIDGQKIPLTIIGQKSSKRYPKKLMLRVYGYYGLNNQVTYENSIFSLLQNGWTLAYAHVRGGSQKGKNWHLQAVKNKSLVWQDLQDCVAYLLRQNYTHPSLLCLQSHSAGAIAVWNAINKSPHLYKAAVFNYPFLDVLNSLLNPEDALSASDYAEFGNPITSKKAFRQIQSLSPYQNIQDKAYPFIYMVGGMNDYRCPIQQIYKFTKRFRSNAKISNRFSNNLSQKKLLVKIHSDASHLGSSDVMEQNFNNCEIYGFLDYLIEQGSHDCKF